MKKIIFLLCATVIITGLTGCQIDNNSLVISNRNEDESDSQITILSGMVFYENLLSSASDKTLKDEDLDHLDFIAFGRFGKKPDYYIYDFENGFVFNVSNVRGIEIEKSLMVADETLKNNIISKLEELNAEDWWGVTYDENSIELQNWFDGSDYGDSWYLWLKFDNGEVIRLRGAGYDATVYGTAELNEFHQYIRSLAVSD